MLAALHTFTGAGTDGAYPEGDLVQGRDGNFYGTTSQGGSNDMGTVFRITPAAGFTTLHSFSALDAQRDNADGALPRAGLVVGRDGNFYGTTDIGGSNGTGTVFQITPAGAFTTPYTFPDNDGDGVDPSALILERIPFE